MNKYLSTFKMLLDKLNGDNMVLAGTLALKSHGLLMSREGDDLDVVIFTPTKAQLQVLESLQTLATNKEAHDYPIESTKVLKFRKDGLGLDILLEQKETPPNLLLYPYQGTYYKIQDIAYNMTAKNSYRTRDGQRRIKDVIDSMDLKNMNFNL